MARRRGIFGSMRRRLIVGVATWLAPLAIEWVLNRRRKGRGRRKEAPWRRAKKGGGRRLLRRSS